MLRKCGEREREREREREDDDELYVFYYWNYASFGCGEHRKGVSL